jgi:urease accessory protein UreE
MPATGSGEGGTTFLLDLPQATALRDGDGLVLDDSSIVRVGTASAVDPNRSCMSAGWQLAREKSLVPKVP